MTSSDFSYHIASAFPNGYTSTTPKSSANIPRPRHGDDMRSPSFDNKTFFFSYHVAVPTPMDPIGAYGYFFPIDTSLHLGSTDSTSTPPLKCYKERALLRRCNFHFMLQPDKLFALRTSAFTSELSFMQSPTMNV